MPVTIYAHLTWTTHQRDPTIDAAGAEFLERFLPATATRYGATVIKAGIVSDHVHLLLLLPPVIDIPRLVQGLKGASARIINRERVIAGKKLRWATGYDLRSVSPRAAGKVREYVASQARRHPHVRIDG